MTPDPTPLDPVPIPPEAFANAVRARDLGAIGDLFTEDAELHTPIIDEPIVGRDNIGAVFMILEEILDDIEITTEISDGDQYVFGFHARVGGERLHVLDLLTLDQDGRITTFAVHTRPLAGTMALAAAIDPSRAQFRP